jgi:hypothetical protein
MVLRKKVITPFFVCVSIFWLLATPALFSQQDSLLVITPDSLPVIEQPKLQAEKVHSPHKATFYSAVLPGLGQAYNKKYWKIPILYAGIGAVGYAIHFNTKYYKIYKAAYRDFIIQDPNNKSYLDVMPPGLTEEYIMQNADWFESALSNKKNYYRRYRDLSYIGMVLVYVVNLVDASVDAHFYNFDISDDLSLKVEPVMVDPQVAPYSGPGIAFKFRF